MRISSVRSGLLVLALAIHAASQNELQGTDPAAISRQDDVQRLARALREPGPDAAVGRRQAIAALLLKPEEPAHQLLRLALIDPELDLATVGEILEALAARLNLSGDPVFGAEDIRAREVPRYVRVLVGFSADALPVGVVGPTPSAPGPFSPVGPTGPVVAPGPTDTTPTNGNGEHTPNGTVPRPVARTLDPQQMAERRLAAREVLLVLRLKERRDSLEAIAAEGPTWTVAAIRAGGQCRDLGLASWIAVYLDSEVHRGEARSALEQLTFEPAFPDRATFEAWYELNRTVRYVELAERVARSAATKVRETEAAGQLAMIERSARLVRALVRSDSPDWRLLAQEVLQSDLPGEASGRIVEALREELAERNRANLTPGGGREARMDFVMNLLGRLDAEPTQREAVLEAVAYLAFDSEGELRTAIENLLRDALKTDGEMPRRAALRGLSRYPSVEDRRAVVDTGAIALERGEDTVLRAALRCLRTPGWSAPDPGETADRAAWVRLVRQVLASAQVEREIKELALEVAVLQTSNRNPVEEVFADLQRIVQSTQTDSALRQQIVPRLMLFTRNESLVEGFVKTIVELLGDADVAIRRHAALQLRAPLNGGSAQSRTWRSQMVDAAVRRVPAESDQSVLNALVNGLTAAAEDAELAPQVIDQLTATASAATTDQARREALIEGLRILGVDTRRTIDEWVEIGEALAALRARDALLDVLRQQSAATATAATDAESAKGLTLIVRAAGLAPREFDWATTTEEAESVLLAFTRLEEQGRPLTDTAERTLRVRVASGVGRHEYVIAAVPVALDDDKADWSDEQRADLLIALVRAHLASETLAKAEQALRELDEIDPDARLALVNWTEIATRRLAAGEPAAAIAILDRILPRSVDDAPAWRRRFLLQAEARLASDFAGQRDKVLADLKASEERFKGESVAVEIVESYAALRRRIEPERN